jgi:hypothetical protein
MPILSRNTLVTQNVRRPDTEVSLKKLASNFQRLGKSLQILARALDFYKAVFLFRDPTISVYCLVGLNVTFAFGNAEHMAILPIVFLILFLLYKLKIRYFGEQIKAFLEGTLSPGDGSRRRDLARVRIALLEGEDMAPMDPNGLSDPFVEVSYVTDEGKIHRLGQTAVISKTLNPRFQRYMHDSFHSSRGDESGSILNRSDDAATKGFNLLNWVHSDSNFNNSKSLQNQTVQWMNETGLYDEAFVYPILQEVDHFNKGPSPRAWENSKGMVQLDVYDADLMGKAEFMGRATVALKDLVGKGDHICTESLKLKNDGHEEKLKANRRKQKRAQGVLRLSQDPSMAMGNGLRWRSKERGKLSGLGFMSNTGEDGDGGSQVDTTTKASTSGDTEDSLLLGTLQFRIELQLSVSTGSLGNKIKARNLEKVWDHDAAENNRKTLLQRLDKFQDYKMTVRCTFFCCKYLLSLFLPPV